MGEMEVPRVAKTIPESSLDLQGATFAETVRETEEDLRSPRPGPCGHIAAEGEGSLPTFDDIGPFGSPTMRKISLLVRELSHSGTRFGHEFIIDALVRAPDVHVAGLQRMREDLVESVNYWQSCFPGSGKREDLIMGKGPPVSHYKRLVDYLDKRIAEMS